MKIRFWDRLILFLGAVITIAAGAFLLALGVQVLGVDLNMLPLPVRIACIAGGAVLILFGAYLLALPHKLNSHKHDFIVQQTENGELRIAVKAVENLVQKCIDMHEEINLVAMRVRNGREGVTIDLKISLANNISIPLAVASLQKQIKQYLVASSGIDVREVRVTVETAQAAAGNSPYLVPAESEERQQPEPREKQKVPMHQRIFGRGEAAPAEAQPEAPKAETPVPEAAPVEKSQADASAPEAPETENETPAEVKEGEENE